MFGIKTTCYYAIITCLIITQAIPGFCVAEEPLMQAYRNLHTGQVVIRESDHPILQYNYLTIQPPLGYVESLLANNLRYARARSNYIHPLYGPDGEVMTKDWSKDHPHHRGIYWAWPEVDWHEQRGDLHALQRVIARPTGNIELQSGNEYAQVTAESRWMWEDSIPIVREVTTIRAHKAGEHGRYIDLTFQFEALSDEVSLARRGTNTYGGLNIRLSAIKDMQLIHYADAGDAGPWAWSDSVGIRYGGTKSVGLAVFEKVNNPDYPGDWIEYPELPWFQPAFPAKGTRYVLKKSEPLILQYRLWIRTGSKVSDAEYIRQWQIFNHNKNNTKE